MPVKNSKKKFVPNWLNLADLRQAVKKYKKIIGSHTLKIVNKNI